MASPSSIFSFYRAICGAICPFANKNKLIAEIYYDLKLKSLTFSRKLLGIALELLFLVEILE